MPISRPLPPSVDDTLARWRAHAVGRPGAEKAAVATMEGILRREIAQLGVAGLAPGEALLVALRRLAETDAATRVFAKEDLGGLWEQAVQAGVAASERNAAVTVGTADGRLALILAVGAGAAIKVPALFGLGFETHESFHTRNLALFTLPFLTFLLVRARGLGGRTLGGLAAAFAAAALFANLHPFPKEAATTVLVATHLPIALWLAVGVAQAGGNWGSLPGRLAFVRFSAEFVIHFALIALGGAVLTACTSIIFKAIGVNIGPFIGSWLLPCGAAGAVVVAGWLADARREAAGSIAVTLMRIFTPLFAAVLVTFLVTVAASGGGTVQGRELLIGFDVLLAVVLAMVLLAVASRDPEAPPRAFDRLVLALVLLALVGDLVALGSVVARIGEFGFSANRVAALGENLILLANLAGAAWRHARFIRGCDGFEPAARWQSAFLPVYAGWAAAVVIVFPLVFR